MPVDGPRVTHIGGPTTLIELDGLRVLTDPAFDAPGRRYAFGRGTRSWKTAGPAVTVDELPALDAAPLSHDHHADNLDDAGRRSSRPPGSSSPRSRARRLGGNAVGFALRRPGADRVALWISGDTVPHGGVRRFAERAGVDVAVLHLGAVRFDITGPVNHTMTAQQAVELCGLLRPGGVVSVRYEGWSHLGERRGAVEQAFEGAPAEVRSALRCHLCGEPAQRPAAQHHPAQVEGGDRVGRVAGRRGRIVGGRPGGPAEAAVVERDDLEALSGKSVHEQRVPGIEGAPEAVAQHQWRALAHCAVGEGAVAEGAVTGADGAGGLTRAPRSFVVMRATLLGSAVGEIGHLTERGRGGCLSRAPPARPATPTGT
ncbi:hypothetical protein FHX81_6924 [Saccharothrix saharensis]|uniref:Beta-lactamase family protein n=1 Tax=Saccharothrix saharensis TaxID=571190 RepID=A0A543JNW7_9PSEU|nr:hypothetical protein FHX81_6924 [Saccharothrix saharensis]